jgi:hypothetical protein
LLALQRTLLEPGREAEVGERGKGSDENMYVSVFLSSALTSTCDGPTGEAGDVREQQQQKRGEERRETCIDFRTGFPRLGVRTSKDKRN